MRNKMLVGAVSVLTVAAIGFWTISSSVASKATTAMSAPLTIDTQDLQARATELPAQVFEAI